MFFKSIVFILLAFDCLLAQAAEYRTFGVSVQYRRENRAAPDDNNVLITYAGYDVDVSDIWTDRLLSHSILNQTKYGLKHIYSVLGPRNSAYSDREVENSKLIRHLYNLVVSKNKPRLVVVISHSSGSYVADEFFNQLFFRMQSAPNDPVYSALSKRLVYYNLDGAITPSRKDALFIEKLFSSIHFVWSSKGKLVALNAPAMIWAPRLYPANYATDIEINADNTECRSERCLHDACIIESPYNPDGYDDDDYLVFDSNGREVQSVYINPEHLLKAMG
jgi:hypothetical protein